jgi:hypothetical protein
MCEKCAGVGSSAPSPGFGLAVTLAGPPLSAATASPLSQVASVCVRYVAHLFRTLEEEMRTPKYGGGHKGGAHPETSGVLEVFLTLAPRGQQVLLQRRATSLQAIGSSNETHSSSSVSLE